MFATFRLHSSSKAKILLITLIVLSILSIFFIVKLSILNLNNIKIIKDVRNKYIRLYSLNRIVSLDDDSSEIIAVLGLCENIIGRLNRTFPPCLETVPKIEDNTLQRLILLNPDLIIVPEDFEEIRILERKNIPVFVVARSDNIQSLYIKIDLLGRLFNRELKAKALISFLKSLERKIVSRIEERGIQTFVLPIVNIADDEVYVFVNSIEADILRKVGCKIPEEINLNKINRIDVKHLMKLSISTLIIKNKNVDLKIINSIKIIKIPNDLRPSGLRSFLYMFWLAKELYPDLFNDIDLEEHKKRFLLEVYGINA